MINPEMMQFTPMIPDLEPFWDQHAELIQKEGYNALNALFVKVPLGIRKQIGKHSYIKDTGTIEVPYPIVSQADSAHLACEHDGGLDIYVWENLDKIVWK